MPRNGGHRTGQPHRRIHHGVDEPGAGIGKGGEELRLLPLLIKPGVDLIEGFLRPLLIIEGFDQLLVRHHFLHIAGKLALNGGLPPEVLVGVLGDKGCHEQGKRRQHEHQKRHPHICHQHEHQRPHDGDDAGKQLGKAL